MQGLHFMVALWVLIMLSIILRFGSGCPIEEKQALLNFKASLNLPKDDHLVLPSWIDASQEEQYNNHSASDCCNWESVTCSNTTGRVVELHLRDLGVTILENYNSWVRFLNMSVFLPLEYLQILDLSYVFHEPEIAGCEHADKFENLEYLYLDWNNFNNSIIPCVTAITSLKVLSLSGSTYTEGVFPTQEFSHLKQLEHLDVSNTGFSGSLSLKEFSRQLETLDVSNSGFSGSLSVKELMKLPNLKALNLGYTRIDKLSSIETMTSLNTLFLDSMRLNDSTILKEGLSRSPLELLRMSNNMFEGKIPSWIGNLSSLLTLDLSQNQLEGTIPNDICKLKSLSFLDLSENRLIGSIPSFSNLSSLRFIHLQKNIITGSIPDALFESSELITLDLGYNYLSGRIQPEIGTLALLRVLLLRGNLLHGYIPVEICQLKLLTFLDLSHNSFSGQIPICLGGISFGRGQLAYDPFHKDNIFLLVIYGNLQTFRYNSTFLLTEDFSTQAFSASDVEEEVAFTTKSRTDNYAGNILSHMSGLDLSCNQLIGEMPPVIGHMIELRALNFSHNHLQGSIPSTLSMLTQIESLDLSYNNFSGQIPSELNRLTSLGTFNVSYNNLSGVIPETRQFGTFDESSYRGNPSLCGPLLKNSCDRFTTDPVYATDGEEIECKIDMVSFFWSFSAGFVAFLLAFALSVCISPHYRRAWFGFIDIWILYRFYRRFKFHSK